MSGKKRSLNHTITRFGQILSDEDPPSVQVLDKSGKLWTTYFSKDIKESSTSQAGIMPENFAQILTVAQLHDLFAYVLTLK